MNFNPVYCIYYKTLETNRTIMIYLIFLLAIGLLVGWSLWKAPSDIDYGEKI